MTWCGLFITTFFFATPHPGLASASIIRVFESVLGYLSLMIWWMGV